MEWDLGVPLLVVLATTLLFIGIAMAVRNLIVQPRQDEGIDPKDGGGARHH